MAEYIVTRVRRRWDRRRTHRHIAGVCTGGTYYTREEVIRSIGEGDAWLTFTPGRETVIEVTAGCPVPGCQTAPYVRTSRDTPTVSHLDSLDPC